MAETKKKVGKRRTTAGPNGLLVRKSGVSKSHKPGLRKPKSTKTDPREQKPSLQSETARLKRQLKAARMQQEASAEILRAVANASGDAAGPLQLIAETTARLFKASSVAIQLAEGIEFTQDYRVGAIAKRVGSAYPRSNIKVGGRNLPGTVVAENRQIHIPDLDRLDPSMSDFPGLPHARAGGARTVCGTPLRRDDKAIGALIVFRDRLLPFTGGELALLQSFADQAVIAIENARLFNETKEALERQTASADILRVISVSPTDVQPVFDALVLTARRLLRRELAFIIRCNETTFHPVAIAGPEGLVSIQNPTPVSINPSANFPSRAIVSKQSQQFPDWSAIDLPEEERKIREVYGVNSALYLPMLRGDECIGVLGLGGSQPGNFSEADIALAKSFCDQALIAIENTRLFKETREALERQTATADILNVIASSPSDVQPVFEAIAESARRVLDGFSSVVTRVIGEELHLAAFTSAREGGREALDRIFPRPLTGSETHVGVVRNGQIVIHADSEVDGDEAAREVARARGFRSMLVVPMLRDGVPIGTIAVTKTEPQRFDENTIGLLKTFADQAVIAIENTRLFNETKEALERQTATADILRIISRSVAHAAPVFDTILESCQRLFNPYDAAVYLIEGDRVRGVARRGPGVGDWGTDSMPLAGSSSGLAIAQRRPLHFPDLADKADLPEDKRDAVRLAGGMTVLYAPIISESRGVGSLVVTRQPKKPFTETEVEFIQSFADQAAIAIENARLFNETKEALERQTATSDVLNVIASSPTDTQPVFDAIARSAAELCEGTNSGVFCLRDGLVHLAGHHNLSPEQLAIAPKAFPAPLHRGYMAGRAIVDRAVAHVPDIAADPEYSAESIVRAGFRSAVSVPMFRNGEPIGAINVTREEARPFSVRQIELLKTFADQAVIAIENTRLFNEVEAKTRSLTESLQQQTATADVLKVISRSAFDLDSVMHTLARSAGELCAAGLCGLYIREGDFLVCRGYTAAISKEQEDFVRQARIPAFDPNFATTRVLSSGEIANIGDFKSDRSVATQAFREKLGFKSILIVPLMREGQGIGLFILGRDRVGQFSSRHVELVQTFADQAVIAIENARLFDEVQARTRDLGEALEQQTATSEVLAVISRSPSDLNPVLEAISDTAARLCGSEQTMFFRYDGNVFRILASWNFPPEVHEMLERRPLMPGHPSAIGRAGASLKPVCIPDVLADPAYGLTGEQSRARYRATLAVPLLRDGQLVGALSLNRSEPGAFTEKQIELVATFADQAVIAIENTRLFNETKEALAYQTGSSNVLRVIASSPTDVEPVLNEIVESARELCEANDAVVLLKDAEHLRFSAHSGPIPVAIDKWPISRNWTAGRAFVDQKPVHVRDMLSAEGAQFPDARAMGQSTGATIHTVLSVPLLRGEESIGAILLRRTEVRPFNDKQINLLSTFADQAVIAIQNARQFNETREALERQTATADILKVIASSPDDVQPVFRAIAERSNHLVGGFATTVVSIVEDAVHLSAFTSTTPEADAALRAFYPRPLSGFTYSDAIRRGEIHRIFNAEAELAGQSDELTIVRRRGWRSALWVPLLLDGEAIGVIGVTRVEPGPFADHHVDMLKTFADQAVIAISNVNLFIQVQERTRDLEESLQQQTATSEVLQVISRSVFDLKTVLQTLLESAAGLCDASICILFQSQGDLLHVGASYGGTPEFAEYLSNHPHRFDRTTVAGRAAVERRTIHIPDIAADTEYGLPQSIKLGGWQSIIGVPLLRDGEVLGVLDLARPVAGPFTPRQIKLIETFADQAVIAIENARLFDEVQQRTKELAASLDDLRTAQDRLVQTEKLASLGQLTAGIAHEIKNPLNFVNNFSALSVELIDEMTDIFENPALDEAGRRKELDEIRELLKSNLEKVVQHGKRADSIVKNMLLHSREGSGEQRAVDINALLDESLNLAYHGARAEKPGFNITLQRDLDPDAGVIELFPQEITRALLNLISNGFYAASKRRVDNGDANFEPVLSACTRNLGNHIEIRIRDNGTGIPPEVKEKMFNPFFTTKPAGEGTGLGLSMSHDIIVKQHGGRIEVDTQPGQFTEFTIVLPRAATLASIRKN